MCLLLGSHLPTFTLTNWTNLTGLKQTGTYSFEIKKSQSLETLDIHTTWSQQFMMIINYLYSLNHNVPPDEMAAQPLLRFLGHKICLGPKQRNKTREKVSAENRNDGSYLLFGMNQNEDRYVVIDLSQNIELRWCLFS